jgi:hypothetical protein
MYMVSSERQVRQNASRLPPKAIYGIYRIAKRNFFRYFPSVDMILVHGSATL